MKSYLLIIIFSFFSIANSFGKSSIIAEVTHIDMLNKNFTLKPIDSNTPSITATVSDCDLLVGYLNKHIQATLDDETLPIRLSSISPSNPEHDRIINEINLSYPQSKSPSLIKIGDPLPPLALYNQEGNLVTNKDLLGKIIVLNFVFTRCSLPTMCPAATQKMAELQKLARNEFLPDDISFVTITFDPQHDTPGVLNQYSRAYDIDSSNYFFLTGDPETIMRLTRMFGVYSISDRGTTNHTMKTAIIHKNGTLAYTISTADWKPKGFLNIIKKILRV